jgi:L-ascorbate metabolism protein UlaG (beta-lactamase superfamily)
LSAKVFFIIDKSWKNSFTDVGSGSFDYKQLKIHWDGHASVRAVDKDFTVAVDPFQQVSPDFDANIVLITHEDAGHYDPAKLEEICTAKTCVVLPESMEHVEVPCMDVEYISEDEVVDIYGVKIESVPMYNDYHECGQGFGYRFEMGETSIYVAGDTGLMDEVIELDGKVDIVFLPVEGRYTMDVEDAIKMAARIKPEIAVPYHYGGPYFEDIEVDLCGFRTALQDRSIEVRILEAQ